MSNDGYDELYPLLHRIDSQQKQLKRQSTELNRRQNELDAIIEGMNEGLVLINKKGTILSINRAAAKLLDTDTHITGDNLLSICSGGDIHEAYHLQSTDRERKKSPNCTASIITLTQVRYSLKNQYQELPFSYTMFRKRKNPRKSDGNLPQMYRMS